MAAGRMSGWLLVNMELSSEVPVSSGYLEWRWEGVLIPDGTCLTGAKLLLSPVIFFVQQKWRLVSKGTL